MSVQAGRWQRRFWEMFWRRTKRAEAASVARFGGDEVPSEPVVIFVGTRLQAQVVLGHLQSEDIPAMIQSESAGAVFGLVTGPLGEARILVPRALAEKAAQLIRADVSDEGDPPANFPPDPPS